MTATVETVASHGPTPAQRAAMARDGFLVVPAFFLPATTAVIGRWIDALAAMPERPRRHWVYREDSLCVPGTRLVQRIENFCPFHAGFDRLVRTGRLAAWATATLGGEAVLFKEKINFKLPGGDGFRPHQDQQAGWSRYAPLFLTALVAIDPATPTNGCLEFATGRHRESLLGPEWAPLSAEGLDLRPVPMAPGDVILFDSFAPHASQPNCTMAPRRLLYLTYNLATFGDQRARYHADKHAAFPPDIDRDPAQTYVFRV